MQQEIFWTKKNQNGTIEVQLNQKYQLKEGDEYYETIEHFVPDINYKDSKQIFNNDLDITFFSSIEFKLRKCKMEEQKCTICLTQFEIKDVEKQILQDSDEDIYALPCSHIYHKVCLKNLLGDKKWVKCPVCASIFGKMVGDMPDGKMKVNKDKNTKCDGYPAGTITIHYSFGGCHRNGVNVPGTSRTAYLPDTPEGNQVLQLLTQCFDRKLTFTVGRSVTTGMDNQIVWNGVHHKTSLHGGSASFGYPDPTYLKRVKQQLAAKGIVPKRHHHHK